jgi:hypothetical protein
MASYIERRKFLATLGGAAAVIGFLRRPTRLAVDHEIPPSAYPHPMDLQFRSGFGAGFQKSAARRCAAFEYAGEPRVNDVDIASFRKVVSINAAENCPSVPRLRARGMK